MQSGRLTFWLWLIAASLCVVVVVIGWTRTHRIDFKYVGAGLFCIALAWYAHRRTSKS